MRYLLLYELWVIAGQGYNYFLAIATPEYFYRMKQFFDETKDNPGRCL